MHCQPRSITFAGADICGFNGYASEALCARWAALGAWYPFSRDHHAEGFQEYYRWPAVAEVARKAYGMRYRAMPSLYTSFFDSHVYGCPIMRPMFYTFPGDATALNLNAQFMIGDSLLVAPCLEENGTNVNVYFPRGIWYDLYSFDVTDASTAPQNKSLQVGLTDDVPLYVLGGTILTLGEGGLNTDAARNSSLTILVALPGGGNAPAPALCGLGCPTSSNGSLLACGHMYLDGGEEVDLGTGANNYISMTATAAQGGGSGRLDIQFQGNPLAQTNAGCSSGIDWPSISAIRILGAGAVDTSSVTVQALGTSPGQPTGVAGSVSYAPNTRTLSINNLDQPLACPEGWRFTWTAAAVTPTASAGMECFVQERRWSTTDLCDA
ncbi:hypothetical protein WJX73_009282 [Symbiochloris irregularis]|uniref:Alpha-glucosidase n=1 Tax=Symbiochloris irregularis TaxID=706552 RepID=A0AAW1P7C4_9CHLO